MRKINVVEIMNISLEDIWDIEPGRYEVTFEDGSVVKSSKRKVIFDRHLWEMFQGYLGTVPIVSTCSVTYVLGEKGTLNMGTHTTCLNNIFKHICSTLGLRYYHQKDHLLERAVDVVNLIFNKIILRILPTSISGPDFVSIMKMPEIMKIHKEMYNHPDSVDKAHRSLTEWVMTTDDKHVLVLMNKSGAVKNSQFNQGVGPRGFVTDLDRSVFGHAIMNGFIYGLHTLYELITESRTAAKALNAADFSIRESEYTSRRFAITAMVVEQPVPVDCGSTDLRACILTRRYLPNMKGKWYKVNDSDPLRCLNGDEEHLIGEVIKYRHINGCKWHNRKQVCTTCAGALSENLKENTNLGAEAVLDFMHDVTQKTLSFKHEVKSVSGNVVVLGEIAGKYFRPGVENELYIRDEVPLNGLNIILNKNGLDKLMDVLTISTLDIPMSNIGEISTVGIVSDDGKIKEVATISNEDCRANITKDLLEYIKDDNNRFELDDKGNYVIPLVNWDVKKPMFMIPLKERDGMTFLRTLKTMVESTSKRSNMTPKEHFFALADLVLERSNCNFTILEILAYAITAFNVDDKNFRLSRNSPMTQIANRDDIFRHRSKGQLLPYEKQLQLLMGDPAAAFSLRYGEGHPLDVQFMPQEMLSGKR